VSRRLSKPGDDDDIDIDTHNDDVTNNIDKFIDNVTDTVDTHTDDDVTAPSIDDDDDGDDGFEKRLADFQKFIELEYQVWNNSTGDTAPVDDDGNQKKLADFKRFIKAESQLLNNSIGDASSETDKITSKFDFFFPDSALMKDVNGHTCHMEDITTELEIVKIQDRKVFLWPDSCVALGDRCYSMDGDSIKYALATSTIFANYSYAMTFPQDATFVSVSCAADYESFEEFTETFPNLESLIKWIVYSLVATLFFISAVLLGTIMCICGGTCRCFGYMCCSCPQKQRQTYQEIPIVIPTVVPYGEPSALFKTLSQVQL